MFLLGLSLLPPAGAATRQLQSSQRFFGGGGNNHHHNNNQCSGNGGYNNDNGRGRHGGSRHICVYEQRDNRLKSCQFPFRYRGRRYTRCTTRDDPHGQAWCSTNTDRRGNHISGEGYYGFCDNQANGRSNRGRNGGYEHRNLLLSSARKTKAAAPSPARQLQYREQEWRGQNNHRDGGRRYDRVSQSDRDYHQAGRDNRRRGNRGNDDYVNQNWRRNNDRSGGRRVDNRRSRGDRDYNQNQGRRINGNRSYGYNDNGRSVHPRRSLGSHSFDPAVVDNSSSWTAAQRQEADELRAELDRLRREREQESNLDYDSRDYPEDVERGYDPEAPRDYDTFDEESKFSADQ